MSATVATPDVASAPVPPPPPPGRRADRWQAAADPLLAVAFGAALVAVAAGADGGLQLGPLTTVEIAIDVVAGLLCAAGVIAGGGGRRPWGIGTLAVFAAFAVLTGLSITWAIEPSIAWVEANRTLSLFAVFATGVALVRLAPGRWRALLGGVLIASVALSGYALLTKVFPASLAADETYARLREPFQYWNAVGLMAAIGVPPAVWLGARRDGHAGLAALAYPALGLLFTTILLAYSRGALLAVAIGMALWFAVVPLRLRGATVLLPSIVAAALAGLWAFNQSGLSDDSVALDLRRNAGQELGVLLLVLILVLLLVGLGATWVRDRRPWPATTRRAWGTALLVGLALCPVFLAIGLAFSQRGLPGSVSHAWTSLTDANANTPPNDPSRLTAIGSVRARYWRDAINVFRARPAAGVGAGGYSLARLRFRKDDLDVLHAHGYLVQTAADLGIAGLALTLALLAAWLAASIRTTGPWRGPRAGLDAPERIGLLSLGCIVVVFGVHSLVDWTWFVPGNAVPAMACAGWLVGRGPWYERLTVPGGLHARLRSPERIVGAVLVLAVAGTAAWSASRPQHAANQVDDALAALSRADHAEATRLAQAAHRTNPLSVDPYFALSEIEAAANRPDAARAALEQAVQLQPANSETWLSLANYELGSDPKAALRDIGPALYLDPRSSRAQAVYLAAYRAVNAPKPAPQKKAKSSK